MVVKVKYSTKRLNIHSQQQEIVMKIGWVTPELTPVDMKPPTVMEKVVLQRNRKQTSKRTTLSKFCITVCQNQEKIG